MKLTHFCPDHTPLPQAGFCIPASITDALSAKGITLTFPQTAGDLHQIASQHEHALAHYVPSIINNKEVVFCLHIDEQDFFTFHISTDPSDTKADPDGLIHSVGYHNLPAPMSLRAEASTMAEHLRPALRQHMALQPNITISKRSF